MRLPKSHSVTHGNTTTIDEREPMLRRVAPRRRRRRADRFGLRLLHAAVRHRFLDDGACEHELAAWRLVADRLAATQAPIIVERTLREIAAFMQAETHRERGFRSLPHQAG